MRTTTSNLKKRVIRIVRERYEEATAHRSEQEAIDRVLVPTVKREHFYDDLAGGKGGELAGDEPDFAKAHSSAALAVNAFGLFRDYPNQLSMAGLRGFTKLSFEHTLPTGLRGTPPHLDIFTSGEQLRVLTESKFTEIFAPKPAEFQPSYETIIGNAEPQWEEVYALLKENPDKFRSLDAAQLVKHYLGIRNSISATGLQVVLMYIFWEPENAADIDFYTVHRQEVEELQSLTDGSAVKLVAMSYPELWKEWDGSGWSEMPVHLEHLRARYSFEV